MLTAIFLCICIVCGGTGAIVTTEAVLSAAFHVPYAESVITPPGVPVEQSADKTE